LRQSAAFADVFVRAGMAALFFDYRTFGDSEGEPRHWVSPSRHLADWHAALAFLARNGLAEVQQHTAGGIDA
jgi:alpha/beta superfamily hydrolase